MHCPTEDRTYNNLCYTSCNALARTRNSSMGHHEGSIWGPTTPRVNTLQWSYITRLQIYKDEMALDHHKHNYTVTQSWLCMYCDIQHTNILKKSIVSRSIEILHSFLTIMHKIVFHCSSSEIHLTFDHAFNENKDGKNVLCCCHGFKTCLYEGKNNLQLLRIKKINSYVSYLYKY